MPVWHETLKPLVDSERIALVGVIQEQHADRCRLFAQWHGIEWPILHDPINALRPTAVPIFVALDEHGVVRRVGPQLDWVVGEFLDTDFPAPERSARIVAAPDIESFTDTVLPTRSDWQRRGDAYILWGGPEHIDEAIVAYQRAAAIDPGDAPVQFCLGVAHRMRSESAFASPDDFQVAVDRWGAALQIDPNHYIYRRRIQQYGPRLIKPYPFYDWVATARSEIQARDEEPVALSVEPGGAELAAPQRSFEPADETPESPDPEGRIHRDEQGLVQIRAIVVPGMISPGEAARIHLQLDPTQQAHWNNEAEPLQIWIDAPEEWVLEGNLLMAAQPRAAESNESRRVEFEVLSPSSASDRSRLSGYALYYVCEEAGGQCLFLRQDFEVEVRVTPD